MCSELQNFAPELAAREVFDGISYAKGASVIRMFYTYLGAPAFLEGLRNYIKANAYPDAQPRPANLAEHSGVKHSTV